MGRKGVNVSSNAKGRMRNAKADIYSCLATWIGNGHDNAFVEEVARKWDVSPTDLYEIIDNVQTELDGRAHRLRERSLKGGDAN